MAPSAPGAGVAGDEGGGPKGSPIREEILANSFSQRPCTIQRSYKQREFNRVYIINNVIQWGGLECFRYYSGWSRVNSIKAQGRQIFAL